MLQGIAEKCEFAVNKGGAENLSSLGGKARQEKKKKNASSNSNKSYLHPEAPVNWLLLIYLLRLDWLSFLDVIFTDTFIFLFILFNDLLSIFTVCQLMDDCTEV